MAGLLRWQEYNKQETWDHCQLFTLRPGLFHIEIKSYIFRKDQPTNKPRDISKIKNLNISEVMQLENRGVFGNFSNL